MGISIYYLPTICNIEVASFFVFQEYKFHWAQYFHKADNCYYSMYVLNSHDF